MQNSMWQACPVCNGQGINILNQSCHVCNGHGIISVISGLPPQHNKTTTSSSTTYRVPLNIDEERMNIIGQNGNEGLHYERGYCSIHDVIKDEDNQCKFCLEMSNK